MVLLDSEHYHILVQQVEVVDKKYQDIPHHKCSRSAGTGPLRVSTVYAMFADGSLKGLAQKKCKDGNQGAQLHETGNEAGHATKGPYDDDNGMTEYLTKS